MSSLQKIMRKCGIFIFGKNMFYVKCMRPGLNIIFLIFSPGMNRCDISEDDTSAAIRASYTVPLPENQHNLQPHANGTMAGGILAGGFSRNHQNYASSDQTKQQKLKEKQNAISMNHTHPSNGKKQMRQLAMKNGSLKDVKQCLPGINASNKSDMQQLNKSAPVLVKLNKRKGEHVIVGMSFVNISHFLCAYVIFSFV